MKGDRNKQPFFHGDLVVYIDPSNVGDNSPMKVDKCEYDVDIWIVKYPDGEYDLASGLRKYTKLDRALK